MFLLPHPKPVWEVRGATTSVGSAFAEEIRRNPPLAKKLKERKEKYIIISAGGKPLFTNRNKLFALGRMPGVGRIRLEVKGILNAALPLYAEALDCSASAHGKKATFYLTHKAAKIYDPIKKEEKIIELGKDAEVKAEAAPRKKGYTLVTIKTPKGSASIMVPTEAYEKMVEGTRFDLSKKKAAA